jgi:hypothetical protein
VSKQICDNGSAERPVGRLLAPDGPCNGWICCAHAEEEVIAEYWRKFGEGWRNEVVGGEPHNRRDQPAAITVTSDSKLICVVRAQAALCLRTFELRRWELREGRMTTTLRALTSSYSL